MVALSFVNSVADVCELRSLLSSFEGTQPAIVLKIETNRGFTNLPSMLLEAMKSPRCAVMIARGDLAVECGFERLAEAQEEILWLCEAAHVPVIWATQVLETLAKEGMPSRGGSRESQVLKSLSLTDGVRSSTFRRQYTSRISPCHKICWSGLTTSRSVVPNAKVKPSKSRGARTNLCQRNLTRSFDFDPPTLS